jgi:hypothetical protein
LNLALPVTFVRSPMLTKREEEDVILMFSFKEFRRP